MQLFNGDRCIVHWPNICLIQIFSFFPFSLARGRVWPGLPVLSYLVCHDGLYAMTKIKGNHLLESWLGCRESITRREQPSRVTFRGNCKTWQKVRKVLALRLVLPTISPHPDWAEGGGAKKSARSQVRLYIPWKISSHHLRCRCWVKPGGKGRVGALLGDIEISRHQSDAVMPYV